MFPLITNDKVSLPNDSTIVPTGHEVVCSRGASPDPNPFTESNYRY